MQFEYSADIDLTQGSASETVVPPKQPSTRLPSPNEYPDLSRDKLQQQYPTTEHLAFVLARVNPRAKLTGNWEQLCERYQDEMVRARNISKPAYDMLLALDDAGAPPPIEFYRNRFNAIDRIDLMVSFIRAHFRNSSRSIAVLVYALQIAVVQVHSAIYDIQWDDADLRVLKQTCDRAKEIDNCPVSDSIRGMLHSLNILLERNVVTTTSSSSSDSPSNSPINKNNKRRGDPLSSNRSKRQNTENHDN